MPIKVSLCCNDHRNGNYLGYAESLEIEDITLVGGRVKVGILEQRVTGANAAAGDKTLIVGRCRIPCLSYTGWYGNWCWDMARVRSVYALELLNYLAGLKHWHCEDGPQIVVRKFDRHERMTPDEWRELEIANA